MTNPRMPYYQQQIDPRKLSNREIEQRLGMQYSQLVRENKDVANIYRDCEEVIQGSLALLDNYNRINLAIKSKAQNIRTKYFGSAAAT